MTRVRNYLLLAAFLAVGCEAPPTPPAPPAPQAQVTPASSGSATRDYMRHYTVQGSYDEVWEFIQLAISDRGIKINNVSHIGKMLRRTAGDVGATREIYTYAKAVEFCSATVSRRTMEADPHNIVFCPYIIAVYEMAGEPGTIHIAFRRPQLVGSEESQASLLEVEKLLEGIVADVVQ